MEGSDREAAFDAHGPVEPRQFIDMVLDAADCLLDDAFAYAHERAIEVVGSSGDGGDDEDRIKELSRGVSFLHCLTQKVLDKKMNYWERYCLERYFSVPDGSVLPKAEDLGLRMLQSKSFAPVKGYKCGNLMQESPKIAGLLQDGFDNTELDSVLDSLRTKLSLAGKENADLQKQVQSLEEESTLRSSHDAAIAEILQVYGNNTSKEMSRELGKATDELISKLEDFKTKRKREECGRNWTTNGLFKKQQPGHTFGLEDIQEVAGFLTNMQ